MNLLFQLLLGSVMIGLTVAIHSIALDIVMRHSGFLKKLVMRYAYVVWRPLLASIIAVSVFASHVAQIWLWALLYLSVGTERLTSLSDALYFATVTYTTLGYGDITLEHSYRMLSAIEGANGFLLFGWTTAFIFEVISKLYEHEADDL